MNFVVSCQNSDSQLVRYVANYGTKYSCRPSPMHSSIARNAVFCSLRYGKPITELCKSHISLMSKSKLYLSNLNKEVKVATANARELALMRDGCLFARHRLSQRFSIWCYHRAGYAFAFHNCFIFVIFLSVLLNHIN